MRVDPSTRHPVDGAQIDDAAAFYGQVVKRLGRNARGDNRGMLDDADAARLWALLLDQRLSVAQEASVLMALRIHGESAQMLAAFMHETRRRCLLVSPPGRMHLQHADAMSAGNSPAVVVLYAFGTARRHPALAALLGLWLARNGTPTLLITHDAQRGANTATVLHALDIMPANSSEDASAAMARRQMAWLPVTILSPSLSRVLDRRTELGYRNTAHALVKLLVPVDGPAVLVANYTHPPYRDSFAAAVAAQGLSALLVRGTEGDPVAWEAQAHPSAAWCRGEAVDLEPVGAGFGLDIASPSAWRGDPADVIGTARYCRAVLQGDEPLPQILARQSSMLTALSLRAAKAGC